MFNPSDLSLRRLVAQMFVVRASGHLFDSQIRYPAWEPTRERLRHWLEDWGIGGVLLIDGSVSELRLRTEQLQGWAEIPLLLCADIEEGVGATLYGSYLVSAADGLGGNRPGEFAGGGRVGPGDGARVGCGSGGGGVELDSGPGGGCE